MLEIRKDIEYKCRVASDDGTFLYNIFDSMEDSYYTLPEFSFKVLQLIKNKSMEELLEVCQQIGISRLQVNEALLFFKEHNFFTTNNGIGKKNKTLIQEGIECYFFKKIPLISPDNFFKYLLPLIKVILSPFVILPLCFISLIGYCFLFKHWSQFSSHLIKSLSLSSVPYYLVALILIKIIHELAHAFTAKLYGGRIRKMGLALIFMTPRLYTDVTDVIQMNRSERIKISAAGIFVEILLGGFMSILFFSTSLSGLTAQVASAVIAITMISTLLFNGNFFMKFDGYYILSDLLNLPNLYSRAQIAQKGLWHKLCWGLPSRERSSLILIMYGVGSFMYRLFLYSSIVLFLWYTSLKPLAVVLCLLEIYVFFIKPIINEVKFYMINQNNISVTRKIIFAVTLLMMVLGGFYPVKHEKSCALYIAPTRETDELKSSSFGFIKEIRNDQIILDNPDLLFTKRDLLLEKRYSEILSNYYFKNYMYGEYKESKITESQINGRLEEVEREQNDLIIPFKGELLNSKKLVGKFVNDGASISPLLVQDKCYIAAFLPFDDLDHISNGHIYFKHMDLISASIDNQFSIPLQKTPDILLRKIESDENGIPLDVYFEVSLRISEDFELKNNKRTGLFIYNVHTALIPYFYNSIVNFIRSEFT